MRTVPRLLVAAFVLSVLVAPGRVSAQGLAEWSTGAEAYAEAMRAQDDDPMPVVVYFYADWCGYCKRLNQALNDDWIDLTDFTKVRVNPEKGPAEKALAERFGVDAYPAVFVIPAGSRKFQKIRTYGDWDEQKGEAFAQACRQAAGL